MKFKEFIDILKKQPVWMIMLGALLINLNLGHRYFPLGSLMYHLLLYLGIIVLFIGLFNYFEKAKLHFAVKTALISILFLMILLLPSYLMKGYADTFIPILAFPFLIIMTILTEVFPSLVARNAFMSFPEPTIFGLILGFILFMLYTWALLALIYWIIIKIKFKIESKKYKKKR